MQAASLKFVAQQVFLKASKHTSPKVLQECAAWLTRAGTDFGVKRLDSKWAIATAKALLNHANLGVRNAGTDFVVMLHQAGMGDDLLDALAADVKPATLNPVKEKCQKAAGTLPEPTKRERQAAASLQIKAVSGEIAVWLRIQRQRVLAQLVSVCRLRYHAR